MDGDSCIVWDISDLITLFQEDGEAGTESMAVFVDGNLSHHSRCLLPMPLYFLKGEISHSSSRRPIKLPATLYTDYSADSEIANYSLCTRREPSPKDRFHCPVEKALAELVPVREPVSSCRSPPDLI
jgi:hypothetical protein